MMCEEFLYQKLEWFLSVWWYWLPVGIGFLFRFGLLKCKIWDTGLCVKAIFKDIGIVYGLTILWGEMSSAGLNDNEVIVVAVLTLIYIFYGLVKDSEDTNDETENLLLLIKSGYITFFSFQTVRVTILGVVITCALAILAYKYKFSIEKKTDLFEIIFLSVETIGLSIYGEIRNMQEIEILLFVFYEGTVFFWLNYLIQEGAKKYFGEE